MTEPQLNLNSPQGISTLNLIPCGWAVVKVEGVDGDGDIILFCGETVEETRVRLWW